MGDDVKTLLPPNATKLETALEAVIGRIGDVEVPIRELWNPQTCPAALLPWLAWALSVDIWDSSWSTETKRAVIAESIPLHRKKGTPWAVERALVVAGSPAAKVIEWFDYPVTAGSPYHFKVEIDIEGETVSAALEAKLTAIINAFKNERSVLDGIDYNLATTGDVPVVGVGIQSGEIITVYPL